MIQLSRGFGSSIPSGSTAYSQRRRLTVTPDAAAAVGALAARIEAASSRRKRRRTRIGWWSFLPGRDQRASGHPIIGRRNVPGPVFVHEGEGRGKARDGDAGIRGAAAAASRTAAGPAALL